MFEANTEMLHLKFIQQKQIRFGIVPFFFKYLHKYIHLSESKSSHEVNKGTTPLRPPPHHCLRQGRANHHHNSYWFDHHLLLLQTHYEEQ